MEDKYNPKYAQKMFKKAELLGGEKLFFKDLVVTGKENVLKDQDRQRVYIANHIAHADFITLWLYFHRHEIQMPMIPAGKNLDNWFLKKVARLHLGQLGGYFADRDLMKKTSGDATLHKRIIIEATREIVKDGLDFLVFAEGGRNETGRLFEKYDKEKEKWVERYDKGALRCALYNEKDLDIVPIAFYYDHPPEEKFIPIIRKGNRNTFTGKALYYGADAFAYFINRPIAKKLGFNVGSAYMNIGKPKPLSELVEIDAPRAEKIEVVKQFSMAKVRELYSAIQKT